MAAHCIFRRSSGLYESGSSGPIDYDAGTHVEIILPDYPDPRLVRWDGATGTRPATAPEISDHDEAGKDAEAAAALAKAENVVTRDILWDQELRLRAAGQASAEADLAAAATKGAYTQALKARVKSKL